MSWWISVITIRWRHNGRDSVSNHQPRDCLLKYLFRRISKKTSKLRVTGLCAGNSPGTGEFPAQRASNAENVSVWRRHHDTIHFNGVFPSLRGITWYSLLTHAADFIERILMWLLHNQCAFIKEGANEVNICDFADVHRLPSLFWIDMIQPLISPLPSHLAAVGQWEFHHCLVYSLPFHDA